MVYKSDGTELQIKTGGVMGMVGGALSGEGEGEINKNGGGGGNGANIGGTRTIYSEVKNHTDL